MSKSYLKKIVHEMDFEGDHIVVEMETLEFEDSLKFEAVPDLNESSSPEDRRRVVLMEQGLYREVLPKYVKKFEGCRDADGNPLTFADIVNKVYFARVIKRLGNALVFNSFPPSMLNEESQSDSTAESDSSLSKAAQ